MLLIISGALFVSEMYNSYLKKKTKKCCRFLAITCFPTTNIIKFKQQLVRGGGHPLLESQSYALR